MRRKYLVKVEDTVVAMFKRIHVFKSTIYGQKKAYKLLFTAEGMTQQEVKDFMKDLRAGIYPAQLKKPKNYDMGECSDCHVCGETHE